MSSRLDRLFLLLDTASSPLTRKAAALQLGEVQKLHPHELHNLLAKVRKYLYSNSWETRVAAGQAVQAIISNVPVWNPSCSHSTDEKSCPGIDTACAGRMKLSEFDINRVIQNGTNTLLASEGAEFDESYSEATLKDRLAKQRQLLNMQLGLTCSMPLVMDTDGIVSVDDLKLNNASPALVENKRNLSEAYQIEISQLSGGTSFSRVGKGKQKRSKSFTTQLSKDSELSFESDSMPPSKKKCLSSVSFDCSTLDSGMSDVGSDSGNLWEESKEWPFESFCDELVQDLFNSAWVVRHGSATALREIIKVHGKGAGKTADTTSDQLELLNQLWLEDMSLRLTCVLALDKFGDFISDQVIAPVRETCAQALGAAVNIMSPASVESILLILLQLLQRPEWEARHGGLLGLKYCLAVRKDMQRTLIPLVFDSVCKGLQDSVDDVSAVAASALVPVTDIIVSVLPVKLLSITTSLWDALLDLDDLTASTSSILELLASLLSFPQIDGSQTAPIPLDQLIPRLWPFLGHNSSGVRKSVLQTLVTLTSSKSSQACDVWVLRIMPTALRLLYQRVLVESRCEIHDLLFEVWRNMLNYSPVQSVLSSTFPFLGYWLCMLMQQPSVPIDPSSNPAWLNIRCKPKEKHMTRNRKSSSSDGQDKEIQEYFFIGGNEASSDLSKDREINVIRAKMMASKFLGVLCSLITKCTFVNDGFSPEEEKPLDAFEKLLLFHLNNKSAHQRFAISLVLSQWAENDDTNCCPLSVKERCLQCLNESIYYDEIAVTFTKVQQECQDFIAFLKHYKFSLDSLYSSGSVFTFEQITHLVTDVYPSIRGSVKLRPKEVENMEEKRKSLLQNVGQSSHDQMALTTMVQAAIAGVLVSLKYLPEKLNPVIKPLMESIKHEENEFLQKMSASHLVHLMELCMQRTTCPNVKVLKNVTNFLCSNPSASQNASVQNNADSKNCENDVENEGKKIISLINMQRFAEKVGLRRCNSSTKKIPDAVSDDVSNMENEVQLRKRGAKFVLTEAVKHFGESLPEKLPTLWETIFNPLSAYINSKGEDATNEDSTASLIACLSVMEVVAPYFHVNLHSKLTEKLPHLSSCLENANAKVRHMAARCVGVLSKVITVETMDLVFDKLLHKMGATDDDIQRQGAVEVIHCIIEELELDIVPYIVLLIVPLLGRMSDQNDDVRLMAIHCFANLIKLMPLEGGIKDPPNLHQNLVDRKIKERHFLEQLMNPKKLEPYKVPTFINAELRSYQQEGVNWLAFLNRYKLHGILCDDMGLGKTLQSICILAGDHEFREMQYRDTKAADCKPLPSLVVCPPTLTGHWVYEVEKFVKKNFLKPLHYTGPPTERIRLRSRAKKHNLIIASYDIVRNDIDFFGSIRWNYCILDEGHIIKNGKTKLSRAIKQLTANHRLILTGTPIQNNVLELWSLFDFLIPGFLGTEKQFTARYSKPILLSRDAKASSKEQELGVLAMEALHRQVLPFLLRRMKEDVLQDLPPKIIQDYYCELSALQVQLYEDFAKSRVKQTVEDSLCGGETSGSNQGTSHVFQALQYLRKVCNHPKLVLTPKHPEYESIAAELKKQNTNLQDVQHATKLCALKQLLQDCGIGTLPSGTSNNQNETAPVVNQHRALIFCQLKSMLDILEKDLFQSLMPTVSYLRLDGSIPPGNRHAVVHRFNNDPSIDILLLTTLVGGLGLNLTGADTVIFVEHDWNPMKDLQAMDRAHRIGQKKVVNVYRLITRGTLEEKIMGLQKFKLSIANSVINQENSSLQNMGTDQLLDLFSLDNKGQAISSKADIAVRDTGKGIKSALENLPELWDTNQYETEYDLDTFLQSMHKAD